MKAREPRQKVMIKARMRVGAAWRDACILDLSSHGLLIQASEPLAEKSYLELRRGRHVIVARVVWSRDRKCGLRTQDVISPDAILREPEHAEGPPIVAGEDRRAASARAEPARAHEASRRAGRGMEYAAIAIAAAVCAVVALQMVGDALARPLVAVEAALER